MIRVAIKAMSSLTQAGLESLLENDPEIELVSLDGRLGIGNPDESMADVVIAEADKAEIPADLLEALPPAGPPVILLLEDVLPTGVGAVLRACCRALPARRRSWLAFMLSLKDW